MIDAERFTLRSIVYILGKGVLLERILFFNIAIVSLALGIDVDFWPKVVARLATVYLTEDRFAFSTISLLM